MRLSMCKVLMTLAACLYCNLTSAQDSAMQTSNPVMPASTPVCMSSDSAKTSNDSVVHATRYDKRIHRYRKGWSSLIPTQHILQFCGNMGLFSIGVGWNYGKHRQWETQLLLGFVPKYESEYAKITLTLKQNYIPWSVNLNHGWSVEPLQCGLYVNTVFGHDFWVKQPVKYDGGYYPFSTRIRPNIFVGERITKKIPHNRRKYIKSMSFFYELSANDISIMKFGYNGRAGFWDVFGLSLGVKAQLL